MNMIPKAPATTAHPRKTRIGRVYPGFVVAALSPKLVGISSSRSFGDEPTRPATLAGTAVFAWRLRPRRLASDREPCPEPTLSDAHERGDRVLYTQGDGRSARDDAGPRRPPGQRLRRGRFQHARNDAR